MMNDSLPRAAANSRPTTSTRPPGVGYCRMNYLQGDLNDPGTTADWASIWRSWTRRRGPPATISSISRSQTASSASSSQALGAAGLTTEKNGQWRRVVIEKPFGHDLASAKALNAEILKTLQEHQIYRIDHFLGKETVQNIMALRFANGLFEPIWNRDHIDHVQITAAETVGVNTAASSTRKPALCVTWCPTTCSSCWR